MPFPCAHARRDPLRFVPVLRGMAVVALTFAATLARAETVVEYYHPGLDHYFMTPLAAEIGDLDSGRIRGWNRTGFVFEGFASPAAGNVAVHPVCRFYIPPIHGDSHFFSASSDECADVRAKRLTDPNFSGYEEETSAEFYIALPNTVTGACPAGTVPVYRLWNQRADSNHRYTTDAATRAAMIARGYAPEGFGPDGVAMCTTHATIADSRVRVSGASPFAPGCDGVAATGTLYIGAEVEPYVAVDPRDPLHLIGVWQQDRWSNGGARGLRTGYSFDGGLTWGSSQAPFSRCTGGNAANGADFARASDPWVTIGPDGIAYQIAIAFTGQTFAVASSGAVLASRSLDGGRTWGAASTLIQDGQAPFNDKESITADPLVPGHAYAAWDRLEQNGHGPTYFARTTNGGASWEAARPIYDPGGRNQTLDNQIVVASSGSNAGTLYDFFTEFENVGNNVLVPRFGFIRSADRGVTWSGFNLITGLQGIGTRDPENPSHELRDAANLPAVAAGPNGVLVAVWQDARFSAGTRDGIAFTRSTDGGTTWSPPVQINTVPAVQALLPTVNVRADGTIGVVYYDLRNNTADPATLFVDVWLVTSTNGVDWSERHVAGPFDFNPAPIAEGGRFVGDYQGLTSANGQFMALFARTNDDPGNRTDVFASVFRAPVGALATSGKAYRAFKSTPVVMTGAWQERVQQAARRTLQQRLAGGAPATGRPAD
ncbi:MAG TPA: hypothetical protein VHL33_03485 [Casimicrobiaceae bacterium]|nr:hypothetical protein [Casimicrobiaceae bacterium]